GRQRGPDRIVEEMAIVNGHRIAAFIPICTTTLTVIAGLGHLAVLPDLGRVAPDVGPRAVYSSQLPFTRRQRPIASKRQSSALSRFLRRRLDQIVAQRDDRFLQPFDL